MPEWRIEDDASAEWALGKIAEAEAEVRKWTEYYQSQLERVRESSQQTIDFMRARLAEYFATVPKRETKTQQKYSLPSGDLILRKPTTEWAHDDEALLKWVDAHGWDDCVKTVRKVAWAEVKKRLADAGNGVVCDKATGEVCEAVSPVPKEEEFVVRLSDKKEES